MRRGPRINGPRGVALRATIWLGVAAPLAASSSVAPVAARATVMEALTIDELARRAELVALVRAERASALLVDGRIYTDVEFSVEDTLRGRAPGATLVIRTPGGVLSGVGQQLAGAPSFVAGRRYVVFVRRGRGAWLETVALSQGVLPIREPAASGASATVLPASTSGVELTAPRGGAAVPAAIVLPPSGTPLDELARALRALP